MKLVVFIQAALLFVQLVSSGHMEDESPVSCESTLERCINTDCLENNTVLEEIKQELCDIQDTECTENPCKNGGTCINVTDALVCKCPDEFYGKVCEINCTIEYGDVVTVQLDDLSTGASIKVNSTEECDSACTGDCTTTILLDVDCYTFKAPLFSATFLPIESDVAACKSICTSQTNSCRSYILQSNINTTSSQCYTFTVSAIDLPVSQDRRGFDVVNKNTRCDISP